MSEGLKQEESTPVKVLIIGNFLSEKIGTRGVCEDLLFKFREKGWEVYYASNKVNRIFKLLDIIFKIIKFRNRIDLAIVEVYSGYAFIWAEIASFLLKSFRKTIFFVLHGGGLPEFSKKHKKRVLNLLKKGDKIITPSRFLANFFSVYLNEIVIIPNGIDLSKYEFNKRRKVKGDLVWFRAIHPIYNPLMAIEVIRRMREYYPKIRMYMIGPNKDFRTYKEIIKKIDEYNLHENIQMVGFIKKDEVNSWLQKGDIFINTTNFESFGVSLLEAAASGLPVVSTDVGEIKILWKDGEEILLVPPQDVEQMCEKIKMLIGDEHLCEKLSLNGRKKSEMFDWSIIIPKWEEQIINFLKDKLTKNGN